MSEDKVILKKFHICKFLSLRDVVLPFRGLTILVGPNASGKSNVLRALELLARMMHRDKLPTNQDIERFIWAGEAESIKFELCAEIDKTIITYRIELGTKLDNQVLQTEELIVGETMVISVYNGSGQVQDEDGKNQTNYSSSKLALKSAGDYGNKPVTNRLTEFIRGWQFYDFQPDMMRGGNIFSRVFMKERLKNESKPPELDDDGSTLRSMLTYWADNDTKRFEAVNQALKNCTKLGIEARKNNGDLELYLREGYQNPIPLVKASEGTMRLVGYYVLLNLPELPSLIAIEEPERNLHPAALSNIADVLEQLAERTQVIITTHSSQLLDAFKSASLSDYLEVILLKNTPGQGTEAISLENMQRDRKALEGWIADFGIGSAIFDSELLQDIMES